MLQITTLFERKRRVELRRGDGEFFYQTFTNAFYFSTFFTFLTFFYFYLNVYYIYDFYYPLEVILTRCAIQYTEMDTGRVDPRVGSGRVEISEMHYFFFSLSVGLSKFSYCSQH